MFTSRNSSCGKVMFSQACIIPSVHGVGLAKGGGTCVAKGSCVVKGGCGKGGASMAGGMRAGEMATEVDGTHPTGMHSCSFRRSPPCNGQEITCIIWLWTRVSKEKVNNSLFTTKNFPYRFLRRFEEDHEVLQGQTELVVDLHTWSHPDRQLIAGILRCEPVQSTNSSWIIKH